nr:MAG TPA: hypothetical protein [Crassvirales sp.]
MTEQELHEKSVYQWRMNKGIGTFIIPAPLAVLRPLLMILPAMYNKSPTMETNIVVADFIDKDKIKDYLLHKSEPVHSNVYRRLITDGFIKIMTVSEATDRFTYLNPNLVVIYNPKECLYCYVGLLDKAKFKLILSSIPLIGGLEQLNNLVPRVGSYNQASIDEIRSSRPIKEVLVPLVIDEDSNLKKKLDYYNKEISTAIAIFGDFDTIKMARLGNSNTNSSSMAVCYNIARQNGWNENLDMTNQFNIDIDELYSPNALKERASGIYEIIRSRSLALASSDEKLSYILKIVEDNVDKNILIINKHGDFANEVTKYINDSTHYNSCYNYHDKVENIPAIDDNGNEVLIKSGVNKGKPKMLGVKSQKNLAQKLMNKGAIHILSTNAAPDKDLAVNIDVIVITSPLCDTVETYLYRLSKVEFAKEIQLYTLYYKGSLEEKKLDERIIPPTHAILNKAEIEVKSDNNYDYCIVD